MEKTLAIIKPDGVAHGLIGEVIKRIEDEGLNIIALKMGHLTKQEAEGFYATHKDKVFFGDLITFTCSGPIVAMVLEGVNAISRWRWLMGATNSAEAKVGSIRGDLGNKEVIRCNVIHGSDSKESAAAEINYFFGGERHV